MAKYFHTARCSEEGCKEFSRYEYRTKKERKEHHERLQIRPWRCVRHDSPDSVLRKDNLVREFELINGKSIKYPDLQGLFWLGGTLESGFTYGYDWKAFANDFPPGTKIRGRIEVILPNEDGDDR